jgi:5-methylcytosine-specific restriction protein A
MPTAALRACATCGTPGCTVHVTQPWANPPPRIRGRKLQALRLALWAKEPQCRACQRVLLPSQMVRDHIIPLCDGGHDVEENTQPLCQVCSDTKSAEEAKRGQARQLANR